jgi:single-strand DNA-binding protein
MVNKVILIGNVGAHPDIRCFENGNMVAKFRLVTTERYKDKTGEKRELNEWHSVEAWGAHANIIDQYVRKGDRLYVEGKIHYEEYTNKNNEKCRQTVIRLQTLTLLTPKPKQEGEQAQAQQAQPLQAHPQVQQMVKQLDLTDQPPQVPMPPMSDPDDLPF